MANFAPADDPHAGPRHESPDERALLAARDAAVVCDLTPLSVLALAGADAASFLQGQLSCDVTAITPGTCRFGSFNSPKGRMLANFVLWRGAALGDGFAMLLPGDICGSVAKRLRMYVLRSKVTVTDVSAATQRMGVGRPLGAPRRCARRSGLCPDGSKYSRRIPQPCSACRALAMFCSRPRHRPRPCGHAWERKPLRQVSMCWRWLTIHAGVPVITAATQDAFVAQAANWDVLGGIDFQKGCYTGQEIIARTQYLGRLKERTLAFHADTRDVSPGDRIFSSAFEGQPCGTVVNAAPSPGGGCDLLAVLQSAAAERGDARLRAGDGPQLVALPLPYAIPAAKAPRGH